jgi:hypothetical protein
MWTLIVVFLSPYVGTATNVEFYSKAHCEKAALQVKAELGSPKIVVQTACVYQGD